MMPLFISHYTINTPYETVVRKLRKSLERFGLDYEIEGIKSFGNWRANSNHCAWQVQKMMVKYPNRSILRLDADAVVQRMPVLFVESGFDPDIAAVVWKQSKLRPKGELLGGTLYFANNKKSKAIVDEWVEACASNPRGRNSDHLQKIVEREKERIKFYDMPLAYCKIFDSMSAQVPEPVIEHFQASRKFKKTINMQPVQIMNKKVYQSELPDIKELYPYKNSNTAILLGSGRSINNIKKNQWEAIRKFDSWTMNNWVYHPFFTPDFYHLEVKYYNYRIIQNRFSEKYDDYKYTRFIFPQNKTIKVKGYRLPLHEVVPNEFNKFQYACKSRDPKRTHLSLNSNYKQHPFFLMKSYDMSLTSILDLLFKFGYHRIVTFGIDLSNSFYFWSSGESKYGEVHHLTNKAHENKPPEQPHSTHRVLDFIIDFNQRWMKDKGREIFVGHKDTVLYPHLNCIDVRGLRK